ncbi:hypothetical protein [Streptomyces alboflavus]|nr:hypothetical protein [Streptomyces alboflavus]
MALIRDYTARLCAYTDFLDDLGAPAPHETRPASLTLPRHDQPHG